MKRTNIPEDEGLAIGADHSFVFDVRNAAETESVNISGWALSWRLKRRLADADGSSLLVKTTGAGSIAITGTFNADPTVNAQRATVTVADTDTDGLPDGLCYWELKRTDNGLETVLAGGTISLLATVHKS